MSRLKLNIAMSLDGYVAGPDQSTQHPLGIGGEQLHSWLVPLRAFRESHGAEGGEVNASTPFAEDILGGAGATIMGRNMFGGGPGPWGNDPWKGWWGDDPPYPPSGLRPHAPSSRAAPDERWDDVPLRHGRHRVGARSSASGRRRQVRVSRRWRLGRAAVSGGGTARRDRARGGTDLPRRWSTTLRQRGRAAPKFEQVEAVDAPGVTHIRYARAG